MEDKLYWYKASCIRVVDGDTIDIFIDCGLGVFKQETVRLYGVNTPETFNVKRGSEEYKKGMESKNFTKSFVVGKDLIVQTIKDKGDKYGRLLAMIYVDGICLNEELVKNGFAEERIY